MSSAGSTCAGGRSRTGSDPRFAHVVSFERALGRGEPHRPVGGADSADADVTEFLLHYIEAYGCRSQSKIATAAGKFPEPEAALSRPCRETNFGDDLVRL